MNHIPIHELPYAKPVKRWLADRYGEAAGQIWEKTAQTYDAYLQDLPDYGGKKNGHARASSSAAARAATATSATTWWSAARTA